MVLRRLLILVGLLVVFALIIIWQECQITRNLYQAARLNSAKALLKEENLALSLKVKEHKSPIRLMAQADDMELVPHFSTLGEREMFLAQARD